MEQTVFPMMAYRDGAKAMDWLVDAFGFEERRRLLADDGRLAHGELAISGSIVMLATPSAEYEGPQRHAERCAVARRWLEVPWIVDGVLVYVDDVAAHFDHARSRGATILSLLEDGPGGRRYRVADIEGHRWMFAQRPG